MELAQQPQDVSNDDILKRVRVATELSRSAGLCIDDADRHMQEKEWREAMDSFVAAKQHSLDARLIFEDIHLDIARVSNDEETIRMSKEAITRLISMESSVGRSMVTLSQSGPYLPPKTALVNSLPGEILSDIFELIVFSEYQEHLDIRADINDPSDDVQFPEHPSGLSMVCSSWHQLVMNTPVLWSHIDILVSGSLSNKFYARASYSVERAGSTLLSIRIHQLLAPDDAHSMQRLTRWLTPVMSRICCLEISGGFPTGPVVNAVLSCWFERGTPGTVKELTIRHPKSDRRKYIDPSSHSHPQPWRINISPSHLEAFLQPITILRLNGRFARWDSHAYRGLTHLLLSGGTIRESHLIHILSSNPQLRNLNFNLDITRKKWRTKPPTPAYLPNLEILNLESMDITQIWSILRLLAPGTRPITLALEVTSENHLCEFTESFEAAAFFQRSNVTACCLDACDDVESPWFSDVFGKMPNLQRLCLQSNSYLDVYSDLRSKMSVCSELRELSMVDCKLDLGEFKRLLAAHHVQILRLLDCRVYRQGKEVDMDAKSLEEELSGLVPNTKCYSDDCFSDPYLSWDFVEF